MKEFIKMFKYKSCLKNNLSNIRNEEHGIEMKWNCRDIFILNVCTHCKSCTAVLQLGREIHGSQDVSPIRSDIHVSHFAGVLQVFLQNTPSNTKHSLYTFHISFKFCVSLMPRKSKRWNCMMFRDNVAPVAKWCEMRKKWCEMRKKWHEIPCYTFFIFHILRHFYAISRWMYSWYYKFTYPVTCEALFVFCELCDKRI